VSRVKIFTVLLLVVLLPILLVGCGEKKDSEGQEGQEGLVEIVAYDFSSSVGSGAVLVKNVGSENIQDVSVKVTATDDEGNVIGVAEGQTGWGGEDPQTGVLFGHTDPIILPGEQIGIEFFMDGELPDNANLEWTTKAVTAYYLPPDVALINANMIIDEYGVPIILGKIRNDSSHEGSAGIIVDLFKGNKFITSRSFRSSLTEGIKPGEVASFSKKISLIKETPDKFRIHIAY